MSAEKTPKEKGQELAEAHVKKLREAAGPVVYVVQAWCPPAPPEALREAGLPEPTVDMPPTWVDVATVEVPVKSKRETVIKAAIAQAGLVVEPGGEPLRLRALDARSAHVSVVSAVQAAPTVVIE